LVIATIALVAVVMVMSVATPAMAGHDPGQGKSQDDKEKNNPCDALEKDTPDKADKGKGKAKANTGCD